MYIKTTFISNPKNQLKISVHQPVFFQFFISYKERIYKLINTEMNLSIHRYFSLLRNSTSLIFQTDWKEYLSQMEPQKLSQKDFKFLQTRVKSSKVIDEALYNVSIRFINNNEEDVIPFLFNIDVNEMVNSIEKLESKYTVTI